MDICPKQVREEIVSSASITMDTLGYGEVSIYQCVQYTDALDTDHVY